MHTYKRFVHFFGEGKKREKTVCYEVGYFLQESEATEYGSADLVQTWNRIREFKHELQAIAFVNFLNGGQMDTGITILDELLETVDKEE